MYYGDSLPTCCCCCCYFIYTVYYDVDNDKRCLCIERRINVLSIYLSIYLFIYCSFTGGLDLLSAFFSIDIALILSCRDVSYVKTVCSIQFTAKITSFFVKAAGRGGGRGKKKPTHCRKGLMRVSCCLWRSVPILQPARSDIASPPIEE